MLLLVVKNVNIFEEVTVVDFARKRASSKCFEPMYSSIPTFATICDLVFAMHLKDR
jgi:hypothetical protein